MVFSESTLNSLDAYRHSAEKPHNTCTTKLVSSIVFKRSYFIVISEQNREKEFNDLLSLSLHSVFKILLFFKELQYFFDKVWCFEKACLYFDWGKKEPQY